MEIKENCWGILIDHVGFVSKFDTVICDSHGDFAYVIDSGDVVKNRHGFTVFEYSDEKLERYIIYGNQIRDMMYEVAKVGGTPDWETWKSKSLMEVISELKNNRIKVNFERIIVTPV